MKIRDLRYRLHQARDGYTFVSPTRQRLIAQTLIAFARDEDITLVSDEFPRAGVPSWWRDSTATQSLTNLANMLKGRFNGYLEETEPTAQSAIRVIDRLSEKLQSTSDELATARHRNVVLQKKLEIADRERAIYAGQAVKLQKEYNDIISRDVSANRSVVELELQKEALRNSAQATIRDLERKLNTTTRERDALDTSYRVTSDTLTIVRSENNKLREEITGEKNAAASARGDRDYWRRQADELSLKLADLDVNLQKSENKNLTYSRDISYLNEKVKQQSQILEGYRSQKPRIYTSRGEVSFEQVEALVGYYWKRYQELPKV